MKTPDEETAFAHQNLCRLPTPVCLATQVAQRVGRGEILQRRLPPPKIT